MSKRRIPIILLVVVLSIGAITAQDSNIWQPSPGTTWQWQLYDTINTSWDVEMYDIDLFDTRQEVIDTLHVDGRIVICYFSAGSWEDWRDDKSDFPDAVLGKTLEGWEDERWLDISRIDLLEPVMTARLDLAVAKGCDGVEPDNVDGYANDSGFDLSGADQIEYNSWLADQAHERGLSIGLKNDLGQIDDLVEYFDWALNEECFQFDECADLVPFIDAGKAVFGVEYEGDPQDYCPQALAMGFSWLTKTLDLADESPGACVGAAAMTDSQQSSSIVRPDGAIQLTTLPLTASDQNPASSPDGSIIIFTRFHNGYNEGPADIMRFDIKNDTINQLITAEDSDNVNMPGTSWNVVSGRITFSSDREDTDEIWTANSDGSDLFRVTHTGSGFALEPTFSPDGEWIVFELDSDAPEDQQMGTIWKVRADGSDMTQLTFGDYDDRQPNWSPRGERILFQRREPSGDNWDIYTIGPDGSNLRQITTLPSSETDASWSPDGRWIVYSADHDPEYYDPYDDDPVAIANLFIVDAAAGDIPIRTTFNGQGYDGAPSWLDRHWIIFESGDDEQPTSLWMIGVPSLPWD